MPLLFMVLMLHKLLGVLNNEVDRMFVYPFISEAYYFIHWGWGRSYNGMFLAGNFEPVPGQNYNKNMRFIADFK